MDGRVQPLDWYATPESWMYWFRKVNWWNDGKSAGFFFFKVEAGPWIPSYAGEFDRNWFRVRKPKNNTQQ
jgi:hypothetical protein